MISIIFMRLITNYPLPVLSLAPALLALSLERQEGRGINCGGMCVCVCIYFECVSLDIVLCLLIAGVLIKPIQADSLHQPLSDISHVCVVSPLSLRVFSNPRVVFPRAGKRIRLHSDTVRFQWRVDVCDCVELGSVRDDDGGVTRAPVPIWVW